MSRAKKPPAEVVIEFRPETDAFCEVIGKLETMEPEVSASVLEHIRMMTKEMLS